MKNDSTLIPNLKVLINRDYSRKDIFTPPIYQRAQEYKLELSPEMSRFHLYDWKELNFPVFTYKRSNNVLKTEVNNISLMFKHISMLQSNIDDTKDKLTNTGLELSMFINNSFNPTPKFNYTKHFIILRDTNIEIHDNIELDVALVKNELMFYRFEDMEDLINLIDPPPSNRILSATKKQLSICNNIYTKYGNHSESLELLNEDYEHALDIYNHLSEVIKSELAKVKIINLSTSHIPECFDPEMHELVAVQNGDKLEVFFVHNENAEIFVHSIKRSYDLTI